MIHLFLHFSKAFGLQELLFRNGFCQFAKKLLSNLALVSFRWLSALFNFSSYCCMPSKVFCKTACWDWRALCLFMPSCIPRSFCWSCDLSITLWGRFLDIKLWPLWVRYGKWHHWVVTPMMFLSVQQKSVNPGKRWGISCLFLRYINTKVT